MLQESNPVNGTPTSASSRIWQRRPRLLFVVVTGLLFLLLELADQKYMTGSLRHLAGLAGSALALSALLFISWFGLGRLALRCLCPQLTEFSLTLVFGTSLGMGVLWLLLLLAGALHLFYPWLAGLLLAAGIALALRELLVHRADYQVTTACIQHGLHQLRSIWYFALVALLLFNFAYPLFANAVVPPISYDEIAYHLAIPKIYIEHGGISYIDFIPYANWPLGSEMLFTAGLLLRSELMAHMVTWNAALLICASLWLCGRRFGPLTGPLAALIFSILPMVTAEAGTALIELTLALFTFLAVWALLCWLDDEPRTHWWLLSAVCAGLAASTKLNGAVTAAILGLVFALAQVLRYGHPLRTALRALVLYGLAAGAVVAPWYLKAWIQTGNPLWPFFISALGGRNWDALGNEYLIGFIKVVDLPLTLSNWLTALWQLTIRPRAFGPGGMDLSWFFVSLVPLGILAVALTRSARRVLLLWLTLITGALYTAWFFETHQTRFLLPVTPALVLIMAYGLNWIYGLRQQRSWQIAVQTLVIGAFAASTWVSHENFRQTLAARGSFLAGRQSREDFLTAHLLPYRTLNYANEHLPPDSRVIFTLYESRGYYLDRDYMWLNPISQRAIKLEQYPNAAALYKQLRHLGFTHLVFAPKYVDQYLNVPYGLQNTALVKDLMQQYGRLLYATPDLVLYELKPNP